MSSRRIRVDKALAYLLGKTGCIHPFQASRILALAEIYSIQETGVKLTDAIYVAGPGVFYIEGVKEIIKENPCFEKIEGDHTTGRKGCIKYICKDEPRIPGLAKKFLDKAIDTASTLDPMQLNSLVINHPYYKQLLQNAG